MNDRRPELAVEFPAVPSADQGGFRTSIGIIGLKEQIVKVAAVFRDQTRVPVGQIRLRRLRTAEEKGGPLVSVVIPCYRQAHFLHEAIESVLRQTYSNVELIVVDDGSPDNAEPVAASYPGVVYVRQENAWASAARNTGLKRSAGDFVVFLDADDRLMPGAVLAGVDQLREHPAYAFISGQFRYIGTNGRIISVPKKKQVRQDHGRELLRQNYISMLAAVMYRRARLQEMGGFDTSLRGCEDYDLFLRIARHHPVGCHDKIVAEYRRHGGNVSRDSARMLRTALAVLRSQIKFIEGNPENRKAYQEGSKQWRKYYAGFLMDQIRARLELGSIKSAGQDMLTLLRYAPRSLQDLCTSAAKQ